MVNGLISMMIRRISDTIQMWEERLRGLQRGLSDPRRYLVDQAIRVDELAGVLPLYWDQRMNNYRQSLQILLKTLQGRTMLEEYSKLKERVASYENMIKLLAVRTLDHHRHGLERSINTLNAVSPWRVLQRGYSITRTLPGLKVVADALQVHTDDRVHVTLASGYLVCRVEESHTEPAPDTAHKRRKNKIET